MDPTTTRNGRSSTGLPRVTRGWTLGEPDDLPKGYGYLVHTGMDPSRCRTVRPASRLPRACGDGPQVGAQKQWQVSVTPCTRGSTGLTQLTTAILVPAYFFLARWR